MADLQVSIALLLENQDEIRRALEAEGGRAGQAFRNRLSPEAQKAFAEITSAAEKAAKDVGVRFNSTKLQFETVKTGELIPSSVLDRLGKINKEFENARRHVDVFTSAIVTQGKEAASSLNLLEAAVTGVAQSLTSKMTDAAMSGIGALKNMIGGFMELDTELRSAAAAAGEADGYERLGAVVEKVGIDAAGTSKQVAELATSLVKAGFNVSEVETALPGVVRGAEATGTAFERFGEIVGSTLRQFGLEASEIGRVTDVMTQTVNQTNATTEGFAYAMNEAAPVAKALGVSLEDTAAAIGIMANAGLQGSVAGTGLKTMLLKLQQAAGGASPEVLGLAMGQERLAKIMKMMGGSVLDATGKLLPLDQVFQKIKATMDTLGTGDRAALATALFGEDGGPKFLAIINQGGAAIDGVFTKVRNSAGAVDAAREATNGFGRQITTLTGTLDSLAIGVGKVAADGLTPLLSAANTVIGILAGLPAPIKEGAAALAIMGTTAVSAGIGLAGLNAAVGMLGGWTALAGSISTVVALLSGPIAGTVGIVLALGAAAGVVSSQFGGVDSGMKRLIQAAGGLAAFIGVLRTIKILQDAWTKSTEATAVAQTFVSALSGPGGLAKIAAAAVIAGGTYVALGAAIKETGQETAELESKAKTLKDKLASLDEQISQGKKLNVDTSDLEKIRAETLAELKTVENPLEIKLNIEQAEAKVKSLKEQLGKLGEDDKQAPVLKAQIAAAEKMKEIMQAAKEGVGSSAYQKLDADAKEFVRTQVQIKSEMDALRAKQIKLDPELDKEEWAKIEQQIAALANKSSNAKLKFGAELDLGSLERERAKLESKLTRVKVPISQGFGETDANFAKRQTEQKKEEASITEQIYAIILKQRQAQEENNGAAEKGLTIAEQKAKTAAENFEAAKKEAEAEGMALGNQQKQIDNANKLMSLDKARLESIQKMADAYLNIANAQTGLTQSEFDVDKARNNRDVNVASEELQALRDRKASEGEIAAKEEEIKQLKEQGRQIEKEALAAAMEGAARRFEMERKILELKQMAAKLEQEAAVRAAQRAELDDKRQLIDLKSKQADPNLTADQKAALGEAIALQGESLKLSQAQTAAEKERLGNIDKEFAMEKELLGLKQKTEVNQFRAKAAEQGWEGDLSPQLNGLDKAAGKLGQNKTTWDDIAKQADHITGTIAKHNEEIAKGNKKLGDLAKGYKGVGESAGGGKAPEVSSGEKARQEELKRTQDWKKQMEAAGYVELKVEGMPQGVSDGILKEVLTGQKQPQVDAWFASPEGRAAVEGWRSSVQGATDDLGNFDAAAQQASMSVQDIDVDQQTAESLQQMRDQLFGPEARQKLFITPQVDTTQAAQDLQSFKDQQSQDPFSFDFTSTGLDQVQADFANAANSIVPFSAQVDQLGMDLQNLGGEGVDPFANTGQSLAEAAYGVEGLVQGLETAQQAAVDFDTTLADSANADQIQQAYDALKPPDVSQAVAEQGNLAQGTEGTVSTTQDLANSWIGVASSINTAAQALANYKSQEGGSQARFAGGDVFGGRQYTVNELGQESFLSSTGRLSLIRAPQYGHWTAPSRGLVIPASMTSRLEAAGAFSRGGGPGPRVSAALVRPSTGAGREVAALGRLQRSIDRLEKTMGSYRPPDVSVSMPGNAGLLHTLQSFR